jgi:hypothetical protein
LIWKYVSIAPVIFNLVKKGMTSQPHTQAAVFSGPKPPASIKQKGEWAS